MHGLAGMVLASCQPQRPDMTEAQHRESRAIWWASVIAAELPDIDIIMMPTGPMAHLQYHRGLMHSLFMAPVLALGVAVLLGLLFKKRPAAGTSLADGHVAGIRHSRLFLWALLGVVGGHLFLDWITSFGVRFLLPFNNTWFASDWTAEVELGMLIPPLLALLVSLWRPALRVRLLRLAGVVMVATLAYRGVSHTLLQHAVAHAYHVPAQAVTLEPVIYQETEWEYVVAEPATYRLGRIGLDADLVERAALPRLHPQESPVLAAAVATPPGRMIWHFARNPVLSAAIIPGGYDVVVSDLRGGYAFNFDLRLDAKEHLTSVRRDYRHTYMQAPASLASR